MNISDLIKVLETIKKEYGDVDVMFSSPNEDGGPYSVERASFSVAEKGQFPKSFMMPAGFKYVELEN